MDMLIKALFEGCIHMHPPRFVRPGDIVKVDPMTAFKLIRRGKAEKHVQKPTDVEVRVHPTVSVEPGDLSGADTADEMTMRELRDALRARGIEIPYRARKQQLMELYESS
jgi:hypothetical protein